MPISGRHAVSGKLLAGTRPITMPGIMGIVPNTGRLQSGQIRRSTLSGGRRRRWIKCSVLSGSIFEDADLEDSDFTDAYLGDFDQRKLCKNPTLKGENPITGAPTRPSAGCPALKE